VIRGMPSGTEPRTRPCQQYDNTMDGEMERWMDDESNICFSLTGTRHTPSSINIDRMHSLTALPNDRSLAYFTYVGGLPVYDSIANDDV